MSVLRTPVFRIHQCMDPDPKNANRVGVYARATIEHQEIGVVTTVETAGVWNVETTRNGKHERKLFNKELEKLWTVLRSFGYDLSDMTPTDPGRERAGTTTS